MRGRYCVHSKINIRLYQVRTARGARGEPASGRVRSSSSKAVGLQKIIRRLLAPARPQVGMIADSKPTAGFQRVVQRAVIHVQSAGREEVTGANLLTAIFAEHESHAAYFLEEAKLTRYDVVNYIAHGIRRDEAIERIAKKARAPPPCSCPWEAGFTTSRQPQLIV
jgi:ATP-dependent Clp protease ATP-binding subunit ClpA